MSKIVIFSDLYLPTFPTLELPLYDCLKEKIKTFFVLQEHDYRLVTPELAQIFSPISTIVKSPKKDLVDLVGKDDLCILRFGYKNLIGDVASSLRSAKRKILMLDPAAIDLKFRECVAQWVTAKSEWMKQGVIKKFPGRYKNIFATGTIHFDGAFDANELAKEQIMELHGLDTKKKLAILCKASPGESGHQKGIDDEYKQIFELIKTKCPDYELLFKAHPLDHHALLPALPGIIHKNEHYGHKPSWEVLFPGGIKVLRPELGYNAFKVADVVLNTRSSISMEVPFFDTPLINVNRHKYVTNWPASSNPGVMQDVKIEELEGLLKSGKFQVDKKARKEYVLKFCDPYCDGQAYRRTAEIAMQLISGS